MKYVPAGMSRFVSRQVLKTQKNSPTILFAVGVVGMVGTAVAASRATLHLEEEVLEPAQKAKADLAVATVQYSSVNEGQELTKIYGKAAMSTVRLYAPAIGLGVVSIACLTKSHTILKERNAGLTAAYAAVAASFSDYRKRVADEYGEEKENELYHAMTDSQYVVETDKGPKVVNGKNATRDSSSPYKFFFDETAKNWKRAPGYNQMWLNTQQDYCNDKLRANGHLFLNEVLEVLGGAEARRPEGQVVGWLYDVEEAARRKPGYKGDGYVDFGIFKNNSFNGTRFVNGEEASIVLDFNVDGPIMDMI